MTQTNDNEVVTTCERSWSELPWHLVTVILNELLGRLGEALPAPGAPPLVPFEIALTDHEDMVVIVDGAMLMQDGRIAGLEMDWEFLRARQQLIHNLGQALVNGGLGAQGAALLRLWRQQNQGWNGQMRSLRQTLAAICPHVYIRCHSKGD